MAINPSGNFAPFVEMNPDLANWSNQNAGTNYADPSALYSGAFGPGKMFTGQELFDRGFSDVALNANYFRPDSGKLASGVMPDYNPTTWLDYGYLLPLAVIGGGLAMGGLAGGAGAGAAGAGAGMAGADAAGLAAMGADAGLSGPALDAFIASGGTMGSTAAGGGGVGFGAGELFNSAIDMFGGSGATGSFGGTGMTGFPGGGSPASAAWNTGSMFNPGTAVGYGPASSSGGMWDLINRLRQLGLMPGGGGPLSTISNIGSGIYGMYQSNQMKQLAEEAARMQDPFGAQRAQYANKLSALYANPSSITGMPGYQAGLDAVERKMASQGYLGSGNMMTALHQYGGDFFDKEVARLSNLAGAQFAPSGGNALLAGNIAGNNLMGQSLASLGYGVRGLEGMFPNLFGWGNQPTYGGTPPLISY